MRGRPTTRRRPLGTIGGPRLAVTRLLIPLLALLAYLAWPYLTVWRLERALTRNDQDALATLVDLDAVRDEVRRRLNKESSSAIGPVSDQFVAWLEQAIRRGGTAAVEQQIDLDWVRGRLLSHAPEGRGLTKALERAFFDDPWHFSLRIGAPGSAAVHARLSLQGTRWRLTALSF